MKISEITHLMESREHHLPGVFGATKVMSIEDFIADSGVAVDSDLDEATQLPAPSRVLPDPELQDYMSRIVGTEIPGKTDPKTGKPAYTSGKTKTDKYELPYMHRSHVIEYYGPDGKRFDEKKLKAALSERPRTILKENEKMRHSSGEMEQYFNIGFAALVGIAVDETTDELIVVNTCPGAGSCKINCFAMSGSKIQYKGPWLSDGRLLTYLLNNPTGFFRRLSAEIFYQAELGDMDGYSIAIRWHDSGDFFSPEYLDMAFNLARKFPSVNFYAYTKMAGAMLSQKPDNFIINWSVGAHTSQQKQISAHDPEMAFTKNSRIFPTKKFKDLLMTDEKGRLQKGPNGQWQMRDAEALAELKSRISQEYGLSVHSILSYDEWDAKTHGTSMKYNVIIAPGEPDSVANSRDVLTTILLEH